MGIVAGETPEEAAQFEKELNDATDQPFDVQALLAQQAAAQAEEPDAVQEDTSKEKGETKATAEKEEAAVAEDEEPDEPDVKTADAEPEWLKRLPDADQKDARRHLKGIRGELSRRKDAERKAKEKADQRITGLEAKIADYIARQEKIRAEQAKQPPPDPELDPLAFARHKEEEAAQYKRELDSVRAQTAEQKQRAAAIQEIYDYATGVESEFRAERTDYDEAVKFGREAYIKNMTSMGYSEQAARSQLDNQLLAQAAVMKQTGGNFARWVYAQAQQLGYKIPGAEQNGAGAQQARSAAQSIAKGQQAARSPGKSGKTVSQELTWDALSDMDGKEFDEAFEKLIEKQTGRSSRLF